MQRNRVLAVIGASLIFLLLACSAGGEAVKPYEAKDFGKLKGMKGFSDKALDLHFTLYQGYVKNTNLLLEQLGKMAAENQTGAPAFAELKRRLGWEWNGMRLHELYFGKVWAAKSP